METRKLGNSDLYITSIGFGSWATGSPWLLDVGSEDDQQLIALIHRALEAGVNWIDCAPADGFGRAEKIVAQALEEWSGPRPYIFTKCGIIWNESGKVAYSLKADSIRRECEASLSRLKIETIDLYQIHWPVDDLAEVEEGWLELKKLKKEGKARWIGVCNLNVESLRRLQAIAPITSLQMPYSLIKREVEKEILPFCQKAELGVIVNSPMASGLLTGRMTRDRAAEFPTDDWRITHPEFCEPKLTENLQLAERLRSIGKNHGCSVGEVAVAWILLHPTVTGAIVGACSAEQVEDIFDASGLRLTSEEIAFIEDRKI